MRRNRCSLAPALLPSLLVFAACAAPPAGAPPTAPTAPPPTAAETQPTSTPVPEPRLRGKVWRDGRPVIGLVAELHGSPDYRPFPIATAVSDEQGIYAFREPLAPGEYRLELHDHRIPPGPLTGGSSMRTDVARKRLFVKHGEELPPIDFVLH